MSHLFSPLKLRSVTLRNRIAVSPMCQYSAKDGFADDWHLVHLGSRAVGGAGLVFTEATAVSPEGRISPDDLGIWKDAHLDMLARIARFVRAQGAVAGMQLAHAGRKASTRAPWDGGTTIPPSAGGWQPWAPSALPFQPADPAPRAMSLSDIAQVQRDFVAAAKRAREAGFEVIELHAAHGYLAHSFLSPLSNQRTDQYGGNFENRIRFVVETARGLRAAWPEELPLMVRVSATDWIPGGWSEEETVQLAARLKAEGADLIDCSSGGLALGAKIPIAPGYQVPFAKAVRAGGVPAGAVGLITDPKQAEEIIASGSADLVLLARAELRDPYWPLHAARELGAADRLPAPVQMQRAFH